MPTDTIEPMRTLHLDDLSIDDEDSFRHIELYADLKEVVRREKCTFQVLPAKDSNWDRALFLNLTFWGAADGGDVLVDATVPADVVAHVAWHKLASKALGTNAGAKPSVGALFLGEAIASAFDLYLVGRVLGHAPNSSFLATQVPAMDSAAEAAGLDEGAFEQLLQDVVRDPELAFAALRELLSDATSTLFAVNDGKSAHAALAKLTTHRFGSLLHHYELANWILYARAYGDPDPSPIVVEVDHALRSARDPLDWLTKNWVRPALA